MAKVSVVMPTFRQGDHIVDAVDSVMEQKKFFDGEIEFILVIDGFPDRKTQAIAKILEKTGKLVITHHRNLGTAEALNSGFRRCTGDYHTWVSSDNTMHPEWLKTLVQMIEESDADVAYSAYNRVQGRICDGVWVPLRSQPLKQGHYQGYSLQDSENCFMGPSFLYKRSVYEAVGDHRGSISHDYDWWLRAEEATRGNFLYVPVVLCDYRVHDERVTITRKDEYDAHQWRAEALRRRQE